MRRYSLIFGIIGVLAGLGLLFMSSITPKPSGPTPLSAEVLDYNTGKSHELPGTEATLYENAKLGLRFGYPSAWGEVQVERYGRRLFLTFLPKGAVNSGDQNRQVFLNLSSEKPEARTTYWGDLGWYYDAGPTWQILEDVCAFAKDPSEDIPKALNTLVSQSSCTALKTSAGHDVAKLSGQTNTYIFPHAGSHFDTVVVSDERLRNNTSFENAIENLEKLVLSIEFIEPIE